MKMFKYSRRLAIIISGLALTILLVVPSVIAQETGDSQIFLVGFNAYQQKNYSAAVTSLTEVLQKHPDTPLRDMTLFWLSRAYYKAGNRQEAARYMAQFTREYPDNPLKNTVEEDLLAIAAQYEKNNANLIASRIEEDRKAREAAERQRIAAVKAEDEQKARDESERQRLVAVRADAERQRVAALKADEERKSLEDAERQRLAAAKAEAEVQRLAVLKLQEEEKARTEQEQKRIAAVKAEAEGQRLAALKLQEEEKAREEAERRRIAAVKSEAERQRLAALKLQEEEKAREEAERQRIAAVRSEEERKILEEAQRQQRISAAKAAAERQRIAALKAEEERRLIEDAQRQRIAAARVETERQRIAALKTEEERKGLEEAQRQRIAAAKVEAERQRIAVLKAEEERKVLEEAQSKRIAAAKAEADRQRITALKAEEERKALEDAQRRRMAAAESQRIAALKAEEQRKAAEEAQRQQRIAAAKADAEQKRIAAARLEDENRKASELNRKQEQRAMREKAIGEYKGIMEKFPGTPAARTAAVRLKDLGVAVAIPKVQPPLTVAPGENAQILTLEVAQYAAFEFATKPVSMPVDVARAVTVPFEIINRGNGPDSFYLASAFPADYGVRFMSRAAPDKAINQTPSLASGEAFEGLISLKIPSSAIDGLRINYPVQAASIYTGEVSQTREVALVASAPLLRAVVKADRNVLSPGEQVKYRVTLLNVGSMSAQDVTMKLNFPAQYQAVDYASAGLRQEMQAALIMDGIQLRPGESREFVTSFKLREEALAREELVVRADLINNQLQARNSFHGNTVIVQPLSAVSARFATVRTVVIPGQTVTIPATIVNAGNQRERFSVVAGMPASQKVTVYHDLNRDGLRQPNEPEVSSIGPLGPREEASLIIEVVTPKNAPDGAEVGLALTVAPESGQGRLVMTQTRLGFSRPVLQLAMKGKGGLLVPGELLTVELSVFNQGSALAKVVELKASWPDQLELVASEPVVESKAVIQGAGWRLGELGAGEKRVIKATFRVKPGTVVGTGIQLKSVLGYSDQLGNRY